MFAYVLSRNRHCGTGGGMCCRKRRHAATAGSLAPLPPFMLAALAPPAVRDIPQSDALT